MEQKNTRWQQELAEAFSDVESLCQHLKIDPSTLPLLTDFKSFPLRVPRGYVERMEAGNPEDPLLQQVLPLAQELQQFPGYSQDPVGDLNAVAVPGVIHKYHGRVLLVATGACAVHCRYCFRRNFPYGDLQLSPQKLQQALDYIASRSEISEVILSGGDPLMLNDDKLGQLIKTLGRIDHVKRIRIHSRVPVVLPSRITFELIRNLVESGKSIAMVLHANHANELSEEVGETFSVMRQHSITLLNQSVLLKGINDSGEVLCRLSERLFDFGVMPYYLHMLDHANGTGHFSVEEPLAKQIIQHLQQHLPGYLVPRLVKEQAGADYKLPIC